MSRTYHRFAGQYISEAYANVRDSVDGMEPAYGDRFHDDTAAIQRAIDTRRHVLFPKGVVLDGGEVGAYVVGTPLVFSHEGQRCTFLAGAFLRLDDAGTVTINARSQTFTGLKISAGTSTTTTSHLAEPDPCLLIENADGLLLEDVHVESSHQSTLVRVVNTDGITIQGGRINGSGAVHLEPNLNVGLDLGTGVKNLSAVSLAIDNTGHGVVFTGATEAISFVDCTIEQQSEDMILVQESAAVRGLNVIGLHTEAGSGAYRKIVVEHGGGVYGGVFAGCQFGNLNEDTSEVGRVFDIDGDWWGVTVRGCSHVTEGDVIWLLGWFANVRDSCDLFNHWDKVVVVTGPRAGDLPIVQNELGALSLTANKIRIEASKIGFFEARPTARSYTYTVGFEHSRTLTPGSVRMVLASLLRDLADLGLIKCEVR